MTFRTKKELEEEFDIDAQIEKLKEEKQGAIQNMEYQRDITKNCSNTKYWEGTIFGIDLSISYLLECKQKLQ